MALFVLGAGATRGCSFVDPRKDPCLPPLDNDFFTQLQRVANPKHRQLITSVMTGIVDLFGPNFETTMEQVFTTLENSIRMLAVTSNKTTSNVQTELKTIRNRLVQAIAVVLEDSLTIRDVAGHSTHSPRPCDHHSKLVTDHLRPGDDFISFNYDCVLDYALKNHGSGKWNFRYGYGFTLGARGSRLKGDANWRPNGPPVTQDTTAHLYKLHGSLHFVVGGHEGRETVQLKKLPYAKKKGDLRFTIIAPESHKPYDKGVFSNLWRRAAQAIRKAEHIVVIGYSMPQTDAHATALFRTSLQRERLKSVVVVNPDRNARYRIRSVLQRGFHRETRVLSFDRMEHFVAAPREIWDFA
jgi:hypothetical protein